MPDESPGTELTEAAAERGSQLWLFPPAKPMNERFGAEFFRAIPRKPGVYSFRDGEGTLIYVGKAKSLRDRLNSYRYVHPDRDSRKTWRLVNEIREITWEECESHAAALLRENALLREHRPRFNRANVWPWAAVYIGVREEDERVHLRVGRELDPQFQWHGAYKSFAIQAFNAMCRLLHARYHNDATPLNWFSTDHAREFSVSSADCMADRLSEFLSGRSSGFLTEFESEQANESLPFASQELALHDLVLLEQFYEKGATRIRKIRAEQPGDELISPEELVDWVAVQGA
tara:strand:- start:3449 stop:4315 length:867 start_codon:yes stop_codon:yes gene_type:complete